MLSPLTPFLNLLQNVITMSSNHQIPLSTAIEMTERFRSNRNNILAAAYNDLDLLPLCETFSKSAVDTILEQAGCEGLRIYYGMDENLKIHAILVGVNGNNADILPMESALTTDPPGTILEDGQRCPPFCPPTSPLNDD